MLVPILFASVVVVVLVVRKCLPSAPYVTTTLAVGIPVYMCLYALIAIDRVLAAGGIRDMVWSRYALKEGAAVTV